MDKELLKNSLDTMCARCINHEVCLATGCAPKINLENLINDYIKLIQGFQECKEGD